MNDTDAEKFPIYLLRDGEVHAIEPATESDVVAALLARAEKAEAKRDRVIAELARCHEAIGGDGYPDESVAKDIEGYVEAYRRAASGFSELRDAAESAREEAEATITRVREICEDASNATFIDGIDLAYELLALLSPGQPSAKAPLCPICGDTDFDSRGMLCPNAPHAPDHSTKPERSGGSKEDSQVRRPPQEEGK